MSGFPSNFPPPPPPAMAAAAAAVAVANAADVKQRAAGPDGAAVGAAADAKQKAAEEAPAGTFLDFVLTMSQNYLLGKPPVDLPNRVKLPVAAQQKLVGPTLDKLSHLFVTRTLKLEQFKFLPLEQLIQIGLLQIFIPMFKKHKKFSDDQLLAFISCVQVLKREHWEKCDLEKLKPPFLKLAASLKMPHTWAKTFNDDIGRLHVLMQQTDCYKLCPSTTPASEKQKLLYRLL